MNIILYGVILIFLFDIANNHQAKHRCLIDHPLTIIQPTQQQHQRSLQSNTLHPYHIYGLFPSTTAQKIDLSLLKNIFAIASKYFQLTIKVSTLSQRLTYYPLSAGKCGINVPSIFTTQGFNQQFIDLVIFIVIQNKPSEVYVAAAAPCLKVRRPIYGYVIFNTAYVQTNLKNTGTYHSNIYVTMHQLIHILGLNPQFFAEFYVSSTSSSKLLINQVVNTIPSISTRKMIITNNVKSYVQKYFLCRDPRIGGLLQDEGGQGSAGSHWQRKVYFDQIMTASSFPSGLKISALTLSLLKDTGFYDFVDLQIAENLDFGKSDGCTFAIGQLEARPQYSCSSSCDYYNVYGGQCSNKDPFADGSYYIRPFSNTICTFPENQKTLNPNPNFLFSTSSRCFDILSNTGQLGPNCYESKCINGSISIKINQESYLCSPGRVSVTIPAGNLLCPISIETFCSVKLCNNWCNTHGVCVKGFCICVLPFKGVNCQIGCPSFFDYQTNECVNNCINKVIFNNGCISNCPPLYKIKKDNICQQCTIQDNCWQLYLMQSIVSLLLLFLIS